MRFLFLAAALTVAASAAQAATLLTVDLNTPDRITIAATGALSPVTATSGDLKGLLLSDLFGFGRVLPASDPGLRDTFLSGDLRPSQNISDGAPNLYQERDASVGLNIWDVVDGNTMNFVAGIAAFAGSASWELDPFDYGNALSGAASGTIYLDADSDSDIPNAVALGQWVRVPSAVPLPASVLLLLAALAGLAAARRRP